MSVKVMSRVWETSVQKANKLLMLLALADNCNDDGWAYPAQTTLAKKVRVNRRNAQKILDALESEHEIVIYNRIGDDAQLHYSNVYHLPKYGRADAPKPHELKGEINRRGVVSPETLRSVARDTTVVSPETHDPSIEPSNESSTKEKDLVSLPGKERNVWYDTILEVWGATGGRNGDLEKMLRGVATKGAYKTYNLLQPLQSPEDLLAWRRWYLDVKQLGRKDAILVSRLEMIQSSIGEWQVRANGSTAPADTAPTDQQRALWKTLENIRQQEKEA